MKKNSIQIPLIAGGLILAAALSRLVPHPYNVSPIAAMALFGGSVLSNRKAAIGVPLAALLLSDLCFQWFTQTPGFYGWGQVLDYAAFAAIAMLGMTMRSRKAGWVLGYSLLASVLFFAVSNFGTWLFAAGVAPYTHDVQGLVNTYVLAVPFFGNTVAGDLFYNGLLFGAFGLIRYFVAKHSRVVA